MTRWAPPLLAALCVLAAAGAAEAQVQAPAAGANQGAPAPPPDDARAAAMKTLGAVVAGLGLKVSSSGDRFINLDVKGSEYGLSLSDDDRTLYVNGWWDFSKDEARKIPLEKLLEWNEDHRTYFSLVKGESGSETVYLNLVMEMAGVTAATLRDALDLVETDSQNSDDLLDAK